MFKKILAIILVVLSFTMCTTGICFALNCNRKGIDRLDVRHINDGTNPYDLVVYFDKDSSIIQDCLKKSVRNGKIEDFFKTAWNNEVVKKTLPILAGIIAVGAAAGAGAGGREFVVKDNVKKGPFEEPTAADDFCTRVLNAYNKNTDCGIAIKGQHQLFSRGMQSFFTDITIESQSENG